MSASLCRYHCGHKSWKGTRLFKNILTGRFPRGSEELIRAGGGQEKRDAARQEGREQPAGASAAGGGL